MYGKQLNRYYILQNVCTYDFCCCNQVQIVSCQYWNQHRIFHKQEDELIHYKCLEGLLSGNDGDKTFILLIEPNQTIYTLIGGLINPFDARCASIVLFTFCWINCQFICQYLHHVQYTTEECDAKVTRLSWAPSVCQMDP